MSEGKWNPRPTPHTLFSMSFLKKLPWLSVFLLLLTYITVGWIISNAKVHVAMWLLTAIAAFLLAASLTTPWTSIANYSLFLFKSNLRSFGVTVGAALLFFLMIARFRVFLDTLVILAAAILVRIDFQTIGLGERQTFWTILFVSWVGLALGILLDKLI
ncbi:MAG: hypothetical protein SAK29_39780 [Scytonema sp. PMC 1069.18]|nr:hypothetical protein [Scytonema sp. PMC 1069.18]MEC4887767.1 hypothetical protein [Scytonema sp. PMC 1070.18]